MVDAASFDMLNLAFQSFVTRGLFTSPALSRGEVGLRSNPGEGPGTALKKTHGISGRKTDREGKLCDPRVIDPV
jgi:hypothetical protein